MALRLFPNIANADLGCVKIDFEVNFFYYRKESNSGILLNKRIYSY